MGRSRGNAEDEYARWVGWLGEGSVGPSIWDDVVAIMASRQMWDGFRLIHAGAPAKVRSNGIFPSWVVGNCVRSQAMAIRRQADTRRDVISLARLIERGQRFPTVLSRDRYAKRTEPWQSRSEADGFFDEMVGSGRDYIDRALVASHAAELKSKTEGIVGWVHNEVAHYNVAKGKFGIDLTFRDLDDAIDTIVDLSVKYRELILGSTMSKWVSMPDWIRVFRESWLQDSDRERQVADQIRVLEEAR